MKNKKQTTTSKSTKATKPKATTNSNASTSSGSNKNVSKKVQNEKPIEKTKDKIISSKNKSSTPVKSENKIEKEKGKIIVDFQEILKPSEISKNDNVNLGLYVELMNNLDKKDDVKTLAICRLILEEDPNNKKIKELHDIIYENIKENYYESGELDRPKEEKMDKHMKLNKDGEYEYYFSDESEDEKE